LFCCGFGSSKSVRWCARERGGEWYRREDTARLHCTRIGEVWLLPCGALARDLRGLAAVQRGEKRKKEEEGEGIYWEVSLLDSMPGNEWNQEELTAAVLGAGRTKVEDDLIGGSHLSTVNKKEKKKKEGGRGLRVDRLG
jgi:hypothetical protein